MASNRLRRLSLAMTGQTGIEAFDAWHKELTETNYLHNHARMWFASIWIHTLGLPWQAGALYSCPIYLMATLRLTRLDGVELQVCRPEAKHMVQRADNIDQFTNGRFCPVR